MAPESYASADLVVAVEAVGLAAAAAQAVVDRAMGGDSEQSGSKKALRSLFSGLHGALESLPGVLAPGSEEEAQQRPPPELGSVPGGAQSLLAAAEAVLRLAAALAQRWLPAAYTLLWQVASLTLDAWSNLFSEPPTSLRQRSARQLSSSSA